MSTRGLANFTPDSYAHDKGRAEAALYASQDCGGPDVLLARGRIANKLAHCEPPRRRDIRTLENAARMAGNTVHDWRERRAFKAAYRNYRKHVHPMADEPNSLLDSWPFLVCGLAVGVAIYAARAWGLLP